MLGDVGVSKGDKIENGTFDRGSNSSKYRIAKLKRLKPAKIMKFQSFLKVKAISLTSSNEEVSDIPEEKAEHPNRRPDSPIARHGLIAD